MLRHILFYAPARIIPALLSLMSVAVLTRVMAVENYGYFALATAVLNAGQAFLNQWLCQGIMRFYPAASRTGEDEGGEADAKVARLFAACGVLFWITSLFVLVTGAVILGGFWHPGTLRTTLLLTVPQYVLFALVSLVLRVHMIRLHSKRYSALQVIQTLFSTGFSLALVAFLAPHPELAVVGVTLGYGVMLALDWRTTRLFLFPTAAPRGEMVQLFRFGWPMMVTAGLGFVISRGDRFILQGLLGPEAVGMYTAGYSLAEQAIAALFMIIVMVSHPMAVQALEQGSREDLDRQLRLNAVWVLALGLPGAVGFALLAPELTRLFLGQAFRQDAVALIPWVAAGTFLASFKAHYLDHAFTLARRNHFLLYALVPTALVNLGLNFWLVPRFGILGAAYASVISYSMSLILTWLMTVRVFPMPMPWREVTKMVLATLVMAGGVLMVPPLAPLPSLMAKAAGGGVLYISLIVMMNLGGMRQKIQRRLWRKQRT
jgi:O-antigen/teichoic acid export membrane protein